MLELGSISTLFAILFAVCKCKTKVNNRYSVNVDSSSTALMIYKRITRCQNSDHQLVKQETTIFGVIHKRRAHRGGMWTNVDMTKGIFKLQWTTSQTVPFWIQSAAR